MTIYSLMCSLYPAPAKAPAFTYYSRWGNFVSVHKGEFIQFLRAKLALAGVSVFTGEQPHLHLIPGFLGNS